MSSLIDKIPPEALLEDGRTTKDKKDNKERLHLELTRPGSFLSDDESFEHVRYLLTNDRVMNLQVDLTDHSSFCPILGVMNAAGLAIDTFYLSNVRADCRFLSDDDQAAAKLELSINTLKQLFPNALLIKSAIGEYSAILKVASPRPLEQT